jgi:hypothetical protein
VILRANRRSFFSFSASVLQPFVFGSASKPEIANNLKNRISADPPVDHMTLFFLINLQ